MNDRAIEKIRTFLTVVGILLLVIFGSRAAAQARNMQLAGATHNRITAIGTDIMKVLGLGKTDPVKAYEAQPITNKLPSEIQTATPVSTTTSTPTKSNAQTATAPPSASQNKVDGGLHKAAGAVNNLSTKTQQTVSSVTKETSNDFTDLWP